MKEKYTKMQYCPKCLGNRKIRDYVVSNSGKEIQINFDLINNGFIDWNLKVDECMVCGSSLIEMRLLRDEWRKIKTVSTDPDFVFAMEKLKQDDIIEFNLKLSQMQSNAPNQEQKSSVSDNTPKCPTCGSTNIKKISGLERAGSIYMLGLFSKKINKTYKCLNCDYSW